MSETANPNASTTVQTSPRGSDTAAAAAAGAALLVCINPVCARPVEPESRFCPFCATEQLLRRGTGERREGADAAQESPGASAPFVFSAGYASGNAATGNSAAGNAAAQDASSRMYGSDDDQVLVLRAGDAMWHFEEAEIPVPPGAKRALLILDEQSVHLARTDWYIPAEELLRRVEAIIRAQRAPVTARLLQTRWQNDAREQRPRIVAALTQPHPYADIKAVLGVDYLGEWASVHICLGVEPEPLPIPPERPKFPLWYLVAPAIMLVCCVLIGVYVSQNGYSLGYSTAYGLLGMAALGTLASIGWFIRAVVSGFARLQRWQEEWEAEQRRKEQEKLRERLSRTFKVDDARLFASAMREVFQQVVDDIVRESKAAEVVRIEGGQGGFFTGTNSTEGVASVTDSGPRRSDAAMAAV